MKSIKARLGITLGASMLLLVTALWWITSASINDLTDNYIKDRLELEIESILTELSLDDQDRPSIDPDRIDRIFHHAFSGHYFLVRLIGDGEPVVLESSSLRGFDLGVPEVGAGETLTFRTRGPKKESLFVLAKGFHIREKTMVAVVAEDLAPYHKDLKLFRLDFSIISAMWFLAIFMVVGLILHFSFRPLELHRKNLKKLMSGDSREMVCEDVPLEIEPYAVSINKIMKKAVRKLDRTRSALSNLSHAMKGPLTLLMQLSEREDIRQNGEVYATLTENVQRLMTLVDRQLKRARITDPELTGNLFIFSREIPPLARTLQSIYYAKDLTLDLDVAPDLSFEGDRQDFLELMGNLLDNAFKWAKGRVLLSAGSEGGLWFTVEDDGPGVSLEEISQLSGHGVRLDESTAGSGLGLSIVKEIVEQYGGAVSFGSSPELNGFLVRVVLPAPPSKE